MGSSRKPSRGPKEKLGQARQAGRPASARGFFPSRPESASPSKPPHPTFSSTALAVVLASLVLLAGFFAWSSLSKKEEKKPAALAWNVEFPPSQPASPRPGIPETAVRGNGSAGVQVVEWGDFYCPWTRRVEAAMAELLRNYGASISLSWRHFPLDTECNPLLTRQVHPGSCLAAEAAECAREQGAFWRYHDRLLEKGALDEQGLIALASEIGLDPVPFSSCLSSRRMRAIVERDVREAISIGINATPSIFVNERFFDAAYPYFIFERAVEEELAGG